MGGFGELGVAYVALAALVAILGRRRKFGGWGYFFAGLLLTPVISLLLVLASDSPRRIRKLAQAELARRAAPIRTITLSRREMESSRVR